MAGTPSLAADWIAFYQFPADPVREDRRHERVAGGCKHRSGELIKEGLGAIALISESHNGKVARSVSRVNVNDIDVAVQGGIQDVVSPITLISTLFCAS
jgi:hypothetical protein